MRHVFILNPAAGKTQAALEMRPKIEQLFKNLTLDYVVHTTTAPGDATRLAKMEVEKGDPVRLYACGGDGTLLEVATGIGDAPHAELACVPCGSANDFIRFMENSDRFDDLASLVAGEAKRVDAISCNGKLSLNMCSMGLDANVASRQARYKHWPLVSGPMAYNLALVNTFFRPVGQHLKIELETVEGKIEREGDYLFALAANGQYYGGGYHGSPLSQPDDGMLDFILVKKMSHLKILTILGKYKRGEHLGLPCCESFRGTSMKVYSKKDAIVNADGECTPNQTVSLNILPQAISFVYPSTCPHEMLKKYEKTEKPLNVT